LTLPNGLRAVDRLMDRRSELEGDDLTPHHALGRSFQVESAWVKSNVFISSAKATSVNTLAERMRTADLEKADAAVQLIRALLEQGESELEPACHPRTDEHGPLCVSARGGRSLGDVHAGTAIEGCIGVRAGPSGVAGMISGPRVRHHVRQIAGPGG
jgi:hypothetical protein